MSAESTEAPSGIASPTPSFSEYEYIGASPMPAAWADPFAPPPMSLACVMEPLWAASPVKPPGYWAAPAPVALQSHVIEKTTVMLRNLPTAFTRESMFELLVDEGFEGFFNFLYMPIDFKSSCSMGYCFVNFVTSGDALRCWQVLEGFSDWGRPCDKVCTVTWSDPQQGLASNMERYRNSPVMHPSIPDLWRPALFHDGMRVAFPPPTKAINAPRHNCRTSDQRAAI